MWTRQKKRTHRRKLLLPALTAACLAYFGFHAMHGSFGIYSSGELQARRAALAAQLEELTQKREALERQVAMLQDNRIERDMLEEQARRALNYTNQRDLLILSPFANNSEIN